MHPKRIQDILPWVELPSRYLGSEINRIQKDPEKVKLKFLLAFPDLYEIGTSHFGLQILYHLINREPDMLAERVYSPAVDLETRMRTYGIPLSSLESGIPMKRFDIVGFSLLYEMNYTNVLGMLSLGGIPFLASERQEADPLIIAGGPCTVNPEPVADFFDAMVIGDGEAVVPRLTRTWIAWRKGGDGKDSLLEQWAQIEGVYIPKFYKPSYNDTGIQTLTVKPAHAGVAPRAVRRAIISELTMDDFPDRPIVPFGKPIHDRLRLEVARGCSRGCRFCQAGIIYRPVRERSVEQILSLAERSLAATGYEDLSLLSLSTGDYGCIVPLMQALMNRCERDRIAVSFPSLRAGTLGPELMTLVQKVRKTGFTMAVEAGSQRLRDIVNKNIRREDIFTMVEDAFRLGWQVIKLYFMIGLPGETQEDLVELVRLVKEVHAIKGPRGRKGKINVSVNTFIPKSHTPFQWAGQASLEESIEKIGWLKTALRIPRIQVKWQNPENSFLEGLWARGDRRLSKLLLAAYNKGCRFDGWSDHFHFEYWMASIQETGLSPDFFITRQRALDEPLPWDHIDTRVKKTYLEQEWKKAEKLETTWDCRDNPCTLCGVCDHQETLPRMANIESCQTPPTTLTHKDSQEFYKSVTVFYAKEGAARFFGHLEMVNIFLRAIRRACIPVAYSQGFHPLPKVSFMDPLPLGLESLVQSFRMQIPGHFRPNLVVQKLNDALPEGLRVYDCRIDTVRQKGEPSRRETYRVTLQNETINTQRLDDFKSESKVIIRRRSRKGRVSEIDLKEVVHSMEMVAPDTLKMVLSLRAGLTVRPGQVLTEVFNMSEETINAARIVKTASVYL